MKFAAFFRNLNLGRPPAPVRTQLEAAFLSSGALSAESFLTNGTLIFEAASRAKAEKILKLACAALKESLGFDEPAFLRSLDYLAELVEREPFAGVERSDVYEVCVTFLDARLVLPAEPPQANKRADVRAVLYTASELFSVSYKFKASPGSPNVFAEKEFGHPATTRAWNTVCRLVAKHGKTAV